MSNQPAAPETKGVTAELLAAGEVRRKRLLLKSLDRWFTAAVQHRAPSIKTSTEIGSRPGIPAAATAVEAHSGRLRCPAAVSGHTL